MDKQKRRDYDKRIEVDVKDFMSEIVGIKPPEFPVGDTKDWRQDKKDKKVRKYDDK